MTSVQRSKQHAVCKMVYSMEEHVLLSKHFTKPVVLRQWKDSFGLLLSFIKYLVNHFHSHYHIVHSG